MSSVRAPPPPPLRERAQAGIGDQPLRSHLTDEAGELVRRRGRDPWGR